MKNATSGRTIGTKFILFTSAIVIGIVLLLTTILALSSSSQLKTESKDRLEQLTAQGSAILLNFLSVRRSNLELWAANPVVPSLINNPAMAGVFSVTLADYIEEFHKKEKWLVAALLFSEQDITFSSRPEITDTFSPAAKKTLNDAPQNTPQLLLIANKHYIFIKIIVPNESENAANSPQFEMINIMELDEIQKELFAKTKLGNKGFLSIIGSQPDNSFFIAGPGLETIEFKEFAITMSQTVSFSHIPTENSTGIFNSKRLEKTQVGLVGIAAKDDITEPVRRLIVISTCVGLLCTLIGLAFSVEFARRLTKPIRELDEKVSDLAKGDLTVQAKIESTDEVGNLALHFNQMAKDLREQMTNITFLQNLTSAFVGISSIADVRSIFLKEILERFPDTAVAFELSDQPLTKEQAEDRCSKVVGEHFHRYLHRTSKNEIYGYFASHANIFIKNKRIQTLIESACQTTEQALESVCAASENMKRIQLETELKHAQAVQDALFTTQLPEVPGYELSTFFTPAAQMGGDWFRIYKDQNKNSLRIYIGDVTGHGVSSALITAGAMGVVHSLEHDIQVAERSLDPSDILDRINHVILDVGKGRLLMTFCICEILLNTGEVSVCNAGHNPPFIITPEIQNGENLNSAQATSLMVLGNRLGFIDVGIFPTKNFKIPKGSSLVLYTDGLTEAIDESKKEYTFKRLKKASSNYASHAANKILQGVLSDFMEFRGSTDLKDDVSLVVIKRLSES